MHFEEFLWIIFAIVSLLNLYGDHKDILYLKTSNTAFENQANKIFELTLIVTFLIYIYFFKRNYKAFKKSTFDDKKKYAIKLLGSSLLIAGILCLIYFQFKDDDFVGSQAI